MIVIEGQLREYTYRPWEIKSSKILKILDTNTLETENAPAFMVYRLLTERPDIGYSPNAQIVQTNKRAQASWNRDTRKYEVNEKSLKSWLKKGAVQTDPVNNPEYLSITEMKIKPWLDYEYAYNSNTGRYDWFCKPLDFDFIKIWIANGTGKRGQPKKHLMVWYNNQLMTINYDLLSTQGKIAYRDKTNTTWIPYRVPETEGLDCLDSRGNEQKAALYCMPTFVYPKDGHMFLEFNFYDRWDREYNIYEFSVDLDKFEGIPCTKGMIVKQFLIAGGKMQGVNGFRKG